MQVIAASPAAIYSGIGNAFTRISSTEGMRALWRGVSSVIVGAGPAHAVHFGTYEAVKELAGGNRGDGSHFFATCQYLTTDRAPLPSFAYCYPLALAGASSTIASDALMNPFDGITLVNFSPPNFDYTHFSYFISHQTAHADAQFGIPVFMALHYNRIPQ